MRKQWNGKEKPGKNKDETMKQLGETKEIARGTHRKQHGRKQTGIREHLGKQKQGTPRNQEKHNEKTKETKGKTRKTCGNCIKNNKGKSCG